jgi:hypothetical protein
MKNVIVDSSRLVLVALLCFAGRAFAQVGVTLTAPNPNYYYYDTNYNEDVSVGPYVATVNNVANQAVICDDYSDAVTVGEHWNASEMNFSNLSMSTLGNTMWGATDGSNATTLNLYLEAAWLAEKLIGANSLPNNNAIVAAIQYAMWGIFNASALSGGPPGSGQTSASYWVTMAQQALQGGLSASEFSNLDILTPLNVKGSACEANSGCAQEYLVVVTAEGGTAAMYLLLAAIACFGAMFFRSRQNPVKRPA